MTALRWLTVVSLFAAGCAGPTAADMTGTVTLFGAPMAAGVVTATPLKGNPVSCDIQVDGQYVLRDVPVGDVIVTVAGPPPPPVDGRIMKEGKAPPPPRSEVPAKYLALATSDLKFKLKPGPNAINLTLTK